MFDVFLKPKATKDLDKLDKKFFNSVLTKINELKTNPFPTGAIKLTDSEVYRIRVGSFRIIYEIFFDNKEIYISRVINRKDAYK